MVSCYPPPYTVKITIYVQMTNLTNCNGTKQESKCLLIFILTRRFSHQKTAERKEFPGQNQSATQNLTDLRIFYFVPFL